MPSPFRPATELMVQYAAYHRDRRNIATHFVGIPLIVCAIGIFMGRAQFEVASLHFTAAWALWGLSSAWYLTRGNLVLGLATSLANGLLIWAAHTFAVGSTGAWLPEGEYEFDKWVDVAGKPFTPFSVKAGRITDLGVWLELGTAVTDLADALTDFDAVFLAVGAHVGRRAEIPAGEKPTVMVAPFAVTSRSVWPALMPVLIGLASVLRSVTAASLCEASASVTTIWFWLRTTAFGWMPFSRSTRRAS